MTDEQKKRLLGPKDICRILGISRAKLYALSATNALPGLFNLTGTTGGLRITAEDLDKFIRDRQSAGRRT